MKSKTSKNFNIIPIVFLFVFTILGLSVAYSAASTRFAVDGKGFVRPYSDVRITSVTVNSATNGGTLNEDIEFNTHTFYVNGHVPAALGANGSLIVDVTVTNFSSSSVIITDVSNSLFSNLNMEYEYLNVTPNQTVVPAASSYTFQVKIKFKMGIVETLLKFTETLLETLFNISTNVISTFYVSWSRVPQYSLTINATPNDSLIIVKNGNTIIGSSTNGTFSELVDQNSTVTWNVSKDGYIPVGGTDVMDGNKTHTVVLEEAVSHTLTINPTPSDATVVIKRDGETLKSGTGSQTLTVYDYHPVEYNVYKEEYISQSATVQTEGENKTINVVLEEAPIFEGTFKNTSDTDPEIINGTIYHSGYYLVEIWGGSGGTGAHDGSNYCQGAVGGYVRGIVNLPVNTDVYITLGGNGGTSDTTFSASAGGANNGGMSPGGGGGGGGYSAFIINSTNLQLTDVDSGKVLFIAGGGGGGGGRPSVISNAGNGGIGGNITTSNTTSFGSGTIYNGSNGTTTLSNNSYPTTGGTNVGGTCTGNSAASGSLFTGGSAIRKGGGGGAGLYGGAGGASRESSILTAGGGSGGGGGSSFVSNSVLAIPSSAQSYLVNSNPGTSGTVVIKYLGKTLN